MKLGTWITSAVIVSAVAFAGAQVKPTKPATMKLAPPKTTKADWQKMYNKAAQDFEKLNADAVFSYCTPDFSMVMGGKPMNLAQAKASMKAWFGMMKNMHCKFEISKVSPAGGMTMVTDNFNMWGMSKPDPKTHKSDKYADTGTETATWVQMGGKWMMKKLVMSNEKMTKNGKPFNPSMAAN